MENYNKFKTLDKIYPGHGDSGGVELLTWQAGYLNKYVQEVKSLLGDKSALSEEDKTLLATRMQSYLPNDKLLFLVGLGADAVVEQIQNNNL